MICIYHSRDLDGWMSAAIVIKYHQEQKTTERLDLIGWDYGDPIPGLSHVRKDEKVILVDISFPIEEMVKLGEMCHLIWIDHHKSAIIEFQEWLKKGNPWNFETFTAGEISLGKFELVGACELAWKYFHKEKPMHLLVEFLGAYDSFRHATKSKIYSDLVFNVQYGARALMQNPEDCYSMLTSWEDGMTNMLEDNGKAILMYLKAEAQGIYAGRNSHVISVPTTRKVLDIASVNRSRFNPSSYGIDYHKDGYDVFMCYHRMADGRWTVSLYNENGNFDVSEIAKLMGGGGHPGAAGFVCDNPDIIFTTYKH